MLPCTRAHVDDIVGTEYGLFVVFNDNERVAQVAQMLQRIDQPLIVPLMQSYGRFIKDVHDTHQRRSYLGSKPDTLGFTG